MSIATCSLQQDVLLIECFTEKSTLFPHCFQSQIVVRHGLIITRTKEKSCLPLVIALFTVFLFSRSLSVASRIRDGVALPDHDLRGVSSFDRADARQISAVLVFAVLYLQPTFEHSVVLAV